MASSTEQAAYPLLASSGTWSATPSPSPRSPARTARPTRCASTDFDMDAPRKRVSRPSPSAYHSCTTLPPVTTSSEVEKFAHTSSGIRKNDIPGARMVMMVTRKFRAVAIEDAPANCTPTVKKSAGRTMSAARTHTVMKTRSKSSPSRSASVRSIVTAVSSSASASAATSWPGSSPDAQSVRDLLVTCLTLGRQP